MSRINASPTPQQDKALFAAPALPSATNSSAWSRGPPAAASANASTAVPPTISTSTLPNGVTQSGQGSGQPAANGLSNGHNGAIGTNGPVPVPIAGHSRKGSLMVGGGIDIKRSSIAFGTVDSPNPLLSSSPAAPSMTGAHLSDTVKSFGSIDADATTDSKAVKASRRTSTVVSPSANSPPPGAPVKKLDMHALFGARPQPQLNGNTNTVASSPPMNGLTGPNGRRLSQGQGGFQPLNGMPTSQPHPYQMLPGQNPQFRAPQMNGVSGPRSPVLGSGVVAPQYNGQLPQIQQQGFRPSQAQQGMLQPNGVQQIRPNGGGPQGMLGQQRPGAMIGQQGMGAYGMHPGPQGPYPMMGYQQGYYPGYNVYESQQFGMTPQWAPQQHPSNQQGFSMPMSPRGSQNQLSTGLSQASPAPTSSALPNSGGPSPLPTPPSRPGSFIGHQPTPSTVSMVTSIPSTPSRAPMQPAPSFTPHIHLGQAPAQSPFGGLSVGAASFTPRASKAIKITRDDGTAVDIKDVAAAVRKPSVPNAAATSEEVTNGDLAPAEPPKKKVLALPVIVRLESEEQKKARLEEEAQKERIRKEEEREELERKERKERMAKEEAARKIKEEEEAEKAEREAADRAEREKREAIDQAEKLEATEEKRRLEEEQETAKKAEEERQAIARTAQEAKDRAEAVEQEAKDRAEATEKNAAAQAAAEDAPKRAMEQKHSLLTPINPIIPSTPSSPLLSPGVTATGLPPKPVAATSPVGRPVPGLDIKPSSPAISEGVPSAATSLSTAVPIEDLASIVYPESFSSPNPNLNVDAKPRKYRYNREFLMQFMDVCRERPENLPNLEEIGLEAESSSGFGARSNRSSRNSMGPPGRSGAPTGLGIGNIGGRPSFPGQGMGSFTMGNFGGSGSITRGTTSEERYNRSVTQNRAGGMARTPSQAGPGGLPTMHGLPSIGGTSSRGANRSQRGTKRMPQDSRASFQHDPDVAPLVVSSNAWVKQRSAGNDTTSPAYIERKVKALLNKLTAEKFDSISSQILEWANKSEFETDGMTLKLVIKQIFEKATDESHWSAMYARLCRLILDQLNPAVTEILGDKPVSGGLLFRKYLVGRCQVDFETGWKAREDAATAAAAKSEEDKARLAQQAKDTEEGGSGDVVMMSEEYYVAVKAKRRGLGLIQLVGELYKLDMIGKNVIRTCFLKLLGDVSAPDEEDLESTCKLLATVGGPFQAAAPSDMAIVFDRLDNVLKTDAIASRIRFMIMDMYDLRRSGWQSRNKQGSVMTIAEVHQQAAREQAEKAQAAAQATRESMSRGGSRAGHSRGGPQPGEWQSVATAPRHVQRPTDFSNIGRNLSSSGMPSGPSFGGPSSVFNRNKKAGAPGTGSTPPLSRQASSANIQSANSNQFSALNEPAEGAPPSDRPAGGDGSSTAPQRKKLTLQPRSKPMPGQEGEGESAADVADDGGSEGTGSEDELATPGGPTQMSEDAINVKLDTDMKELWGEKGAGGSRDPEDIVEYFKALPEGSRDLLAKRLVDDVFRMSKASDAEVVASGWEIALEQGVATTESLKKGIEIHMPTLDDDAIDFPQAYRAIAVLIRGLSLSTDDIQTLAEMIDSDTAARITPKDKLDRALAAVDEASA